MGLRIVTVKVLNSYEHALSGMTKYLRIMMRKSKIGKELFYREETADDFAGML